MMNMDFDLRKIQKRFKEYYNTELRHEYVELEPQRKTYLKNFRKRFTWCVVGGVFLLVLISLLWTNIGFCLDTLEWLGLYLAFVVWVCSKPFSKFKKATKSLVMEQILSFWGNYEYYKDKILISKSYIKKSALFSGFNKQIQDDAFRGKYHNAEIEVSEQELLSADDPCFEEGEFNPDNKKVTIFKGVLIALHFNKICKGNTIVLEKDNKYVEYGVIIFILALLAGAGWFFLVFSNHSEESLMFFGAIGVICLVGIIYLVSDVLKNMFTKENQVLLEDVVFSRKWKVYADDQVEARYVLTPALMERMLAVKKLFHGNRLDFSFWDNNLLIAVHTYDDMFETTSLFKSALDYRKVQEVICQLYSVFSVIDVLKLQGESKADIKKES